MDASAYGLYVSDEHQPTARDSQPKPTRAYGVSVPSDTQERQDRVWALFIRGIAPERIAAELSLDAAQVASWLAERLTVDDAADQRVAAGEALRVLKRSLFADLERVEPARLIPAIADRRAFRIIDLDRLLRRIDHEYAVACRHEARIAAPEVDLRVDALADPAHRVLLSRAPSTRRRASVL